MPQFNFRGEERLQDWCTWKAVSWLISLLYFRFSPRGFFFFLILSLSIFSHLVLFKKCFAICRKKMIGTPIPVLQAEKCSGCGPCQSWRSAAPSCSPCVPALGTVNCPRRDRFNNRGAEYLHPSGHWSSPSALSFLFISPLFICLCPSGISEVLARLCRVELPSSAGVIVVHEAPGACWCCWS